MALAPESTERTPLTEYHSPHAACERKGKPRKQTTEREQQHVEASVNQTPSAYRPPLAPVQPNCPPLIAPTWNLHQVR